MCLNWDEHVLRACRCVFVGYGHLTELIMMLLKLLFALLCIFRVVSSQYASGILTTFQYVSFAQLFTMCQALIDNDVDPVTLAQIASEDGHHYLIISVLEIACCSDSFLG